MAKKQTNEKIVTESLKNEKLNIGKRKSKTLLILLCTLIPLAVIGLALGLVFGLGTSYKITTTAGENGTVVVTSDDMNMKTEDNVYTISGGKTATVTITPNTGYSIATITVNDEEVDITVEEGQPQTITFENLDKEQTISATFAIRTFTVTFKNYDGTTLKTENVAYGSPATAPTNPTREQDAQYTYAFADWDKEFNNITANLEVVATYTPTIRSYSITVMQSDNGIITPTTISKDYGSNQIFTITPNTGYKVIAITIDGVTEAIPNNDGTALQRSILNIQGTHTVTAAFAIRIFTVTFKDYDGTTLDTQTVNYGSDATAPANPTREGYTFSEWLGDYTEITSDVIIVAAYDINTFGISVNSGANGTISPNNPTVEYGNNQSFTITPNEGYYISSIRVDNVEQSITVAQGEAQIYEFINVTESHTITAEFSKRIYTVSFKDYNGDTLETQSVEYGDTATAPTDPTRANETENELFEEIEYNYTYSYTFAGWKDESNNTVDLATLQIVENTVLTANYTKTLISIATDNYSVDNNGEYSYSGNDTTELIIPSEIGGQPVTTVNGNSIPDTVTTITLPNTITTINPGEFSEIDDLTTIIVDGDNPNYSSENGLLYDKSGETVVSVPAATETVTLKSTAVTIGERAFQNVNLITLDLTGTSISRIMPYAFSGSDFQQILMPSTLTTLDENALGSMNDLVQVVLNSTLMGSYTLPAPGNQDNYILGWFKEGSSETTTLQSYGTYYIGFTGEILGGGSITGIYTTTDGWQYKLSSGHWVISGVPSGSGSLTIPATLTTQQHGNINIYGLNKNNSALTNVSSYSQVIISQGIQSIGYETFYGCSSLTSITIPNSVESIGNHAFSNCSSLTTITIPSSVTSIEYCAFTNCSSLTSINVNSNNLKYSSLNGVLFNKNQTTLITYPNAKGSSYTIPNSVTSIEEYALAYCYSLISITIPNSVTSIGQGAFRDCTSLTSVSIPSSVTSIESSAFYNCSNLTSITINGDITSLSYSAFYNCSSLTSITIPDSVTSIGQDAFTNCSSLTSITIPNSVTSIGDYAFSGCSGLTSITIPNSVTSIWSFAFYGCSSLTSINVNSNNPNYSSVDGVLFNKNQTNILCYAAGKSGTSYIIPNSVTSIGQGAFTNCSSLTSITIPNSVTSIGNHAFKDCSGLTSIMINGDITSLGYDAFGNCSNLKTLNIGSAVTSLPSNLFESDNLSYITTINVDANNNTYEIKTTGTNGYGLYLKGTETLVKSLPTP